MDSRNMMGVRALGAVRPPAPMGRRFLAYLLDVLITGVPVGALTLPAFFWAADLSETTLPLTTTLPTWTLAVFGLGVLLAVGLGIFQWWYQGTRGFTVGKMICKIRTVDVTSGLPVGMWRIFLRQLILGIGSFLVALTPFFDGERRNRGWHDRAARTIVIDQNAVGSQRTMRVSSNRVQSGPAISPFAPVPSQGAPIPAAATSNYSYSGPMPPPPGPVPTPEPMPAPIPVPVTGPPPPPQPVGGTARAPVVSERAHHGTARQAPKILNEQSVPSGAQLPAYLTSQPAYVASQAPPVQAPELATKAPAPSPPPPRPAADYGLPIEQAPPGRPRPQPQQEPGARDGYADPPDPLPWRTEPTDRPTPVTPSALLRFSNGLEAALTQTTLIGRNPSAGASADPCDLIRVSDPGRSVSKTHLMVGFDEEGVWVVDRASTNGTIVTLADGQQIICAAHQVVRLPDGATVTFGDYSLNFEFHSN